jgi:hypothetical protein
MSEAPRPGSQGRFKGVLAGTKSSEASPWKSPILANETASPLAPPILPLPVHARLE